MKSLRKITLILVLISLVGCSKDEDNSPDESFATLTGNWEVTSFSYSGNTSFRAINNNEAWNTSYYGEGWLFNFDIAFNENPNDYEMSGEHKIDHYYTNEDGDEYYYVGDMFRDEVGTFVRNSNTNLTFNEDGQYKQVTILELTENKLRFSLSETFTETTEDNILKTRVHDEIYVLKRIN